MKQILIVLFASIAAMSFWQPHRPDPGLSATEKADLLFLYEEEKLARDVYTTLWEKWAGAPFSNTKKAEAQHMAMIEQVFEDYRIDVPLVQDAKITGRFNNDSLQTLYHALVARGQTSRMEALRVGALIEEQDIADIMIFRQRTGNKDLLNLYNCLQSASENHLRAFVRQLQRFQMTYAPVVLTTDYYQDIMEERTKPGSCRVPGAGKACKLPD